MVRYAHLCRGLDPASFRATADFPVDGLAPGEILAAVFGPRSTGVWELRLENSVTQLPRGRLAVSVRDRQGNVTRIGRVFAVGAGDADPAEGPR